MKNPTPQWLRRLRTAHKICTLLPNTQCVTYIECEQQVATLQPTRDDKWVGGRPTERVSNPPTNNIVWKTFVFIKFAAAHTARKSHRIYLFDTPSMAQDRCGESVSATRQTKAGWLWVSIGAPRPIHAESLSPTYILDVFIIRTQRASERTRVSLIRILTPQ